MAYLILEIMVYKFKCRQHGAGIWTVVFVAAAVVVVVVSNS